MKKLIFLFIPFIFSCAECADVDGWVVEECVKYCADKKGVNHIDITLDTAAVCICSNGKQIHGSCFRSREDPYCYEK